MTNPETRLRAFQAENNIFYERSAFARRSVYSIGARSNFPPQSR